MWSSGFCCSSEPKVEIKESEMIDKYLELARELKMAVEHEGDDDTNFSWCVWNCPQRIGKKIEGLEISGIIETI